MSADTVAVGLGAVPGIAALAFAACAELFGWPAWMAWCCVALYAIAQAALIWSLVRRAW